MALSRTGFQSESIFITTSLVTCGIAISMKGGLGRDGSRRTVSGRRHRWLKVHPTLRSLFRLLPRPDPTRTSRRRLCARDPSHPQDDDSSRHQRITGPSLLRQAEASPKSGLNLKFFPAMSHQSRRAVGSALYLAHGNAAGSEWQYLGRHRDESHHWMRGHHETCASHRNCP